MAHFGNSARKQHEYTSLVMNCNSNYNYTALITCPLLLDRRCITKCSQRCSQLHKSGRQDRWVLRVFVWMTLSIAVAWVLLTAYTKPAAHQPRRLCCRYVDMSVALWDRRDVTLVVTTVLQTSAGLPCRLACVQALSCTSANITCTGSSPRLAANATPAKLVARFEVEYDTSCWLSVEVPVSTLEAWKTCDYGITVVQVRQHECSYKFCCFVVTYRILKHFQVIPPPGYPGRKLVGTPPWQLHRHRVSIGGSRSRGRHRPVVTKCTFLPHACPRFPGIVSVSL